MSSASDTNVLVRVLVQDASAPAQCAAARSLVEHFPSADFADCLLLARATHLGRARFLTFDTDAARLPRALLLQ